MTRIGRFKNLKIKHSFIDIVPPKVKEEILNLKNNLSKIPLIVNGREINRIESRQQICPYDHNFTVCNYQFANLKDINNAIFYSQNAIENWKNFQ